MPENVAAMVSGRGTEEKNIREREEVTRLKKTVDTFRKYSKPVLLITFGILVLQYLLNRFAVPVSAALSHVYIPLFGTPQLKKLAPSIMLVVRWLFWPSFLIWYATHAVKVVQQFEKATIRRFGKWNRTRKPGICLILYPLIESIKFEDIFQRRIDIAKQSVYSKDNIPATANAIFWVKIRNIAAATFNVDNWQGSVSDLLETEIRNAVAQIPIAKLNRSRSIIAGSVQLAFDDATGKPSGNKSEKEKQKTKKRRGFLRKASKILKNISRALGKTFRPLGKILTFYSQEGMEEGWGIELKRTEIQEFELPKDLEDQLKRVQISVQKVTEADNLRKAKNIESEAAQYAFEKEGEGRKKLIEAQAEALNKPGGDRFMAIEVSKSIKPSDKIIYTDQALGGLGGTLARFLNGKNLDQRKDLTSAEAGK